MRTLLVLLLLLPTPALAQSAAESARDQGVFVAALGDLYAGQADAAATKLESLLDTRPDDAAVLDALAEAYAALDRPGDALYHAQLAADATDRPEPRLRLAALQSERGDAAAAAANYEAATVTPTADPAPLIALADLYARLGQPSDERRTIERLLAYGDTYAAHLRLAALAEADGDAAAAERSLEIAVRFEPGEPTLWRRLADARAQTGDADGAAAARARADRLDPAASLPPLTGGPPGGSAPGNSTPGSSVSDDAMTADDALAALTAALNRADDDPAALPEALTLADRALDLAPTRADILAAAGEAAALAGDDAAAGDRLVAAVQSDPRQLGAWALGLTVLARSGDARAGDHADEATLLFNSVPRIVAAAALAYASVGRSDDARRAARSALAGLDADDPLRARIEPLVQ